MKIKIKDLEIEELIKITNKLFGSSKRKTTDEELHKAGESAFKILERGNNSTSSTH